MMKLKTLLLFSVASVIPMVSCHMTSKDEAMKKSAMTITEDFVNGNIDGFVASLDASVRDMYPADEVLAAYQAISMIMGAPDKKSRDVKMEMMGENPVVTVTVPYQGGKISYQSGFDTRGNIIAFAPAPAPAEIVYTEEEIIVTPDTVQSGTSTAAVVSSSGGNVAK